MANNDILRKLCIDGSTKNRIKPHTRDLYDDFVLGITYT
jgi:hypothetical protein